MRVVFFGSATIGFPVLEALLASPQDDVVAVVTQPDRPVGRKLKLTPCPVKSFAEERGLSVLCPEKVGSADSLEQLQALNADLFVVIAYGQYIPQSVLGIPPHQSINLHPSLLPKYRGSSPIQWAIANGDTLTGVTILYVSEKMDSGDIILQREVSIAPDSDAVSMEAVLAAEGADLLMEAVEQIRTGTVCASVQNDDLAVDVRKLVKADGRLDWTMPAEQLLNRIRGFADWPGCFCEVPGGKAPQRLKVVRAAVEPGEGAPGEIIDVCGAGPLVATGTQALRLLEVQPAGKRVMDGASFLRGQQSLAPGVHLG